MFLALDLTEETLAEAIEDGADMIITHHPMIFPELRRSIITALQEERSLR